MQVTHHCNGHCFFLVLVFLVLGFFGNVFWYCVLVLVFGTVFFVLFFWYCFFGTEFVSTLFLCWFFAMFFLVLGVLRLGFLDAIASPSTYPDSGSVSQ